ncbi:MAG: hypothetical protein PWP54_1390 [Thermosipho sp. (in: thermotogales)]|nr:hypothetical protein [Thermosipho sp. (in: thermotogales)]
MGDNGMGENEIKSKELIGIRLFLKFYFDYPLYVNRETYYIMEEIFNNLGLQMYSFSPFLSKNVKKYKEGVYYKGPAWIILKTFYSENLPKIVFRLLETNFLGFYPVKIFSKKIKLFSNGILFFDFHKESSFEKFSKQERDNLIKVYSENFGNVLEDDSLILVPDRQYNLNFLHLYGSKELIYMVDVLGLLNKKGFKGFFMQKEIFYRFLFGKEGIFEIINKI